MKVFRKVNTAYFWELWPANRWLFNHISIDIWFDNDWKYWSINPSTANDSEYFCLNFYLGPLNVSYTYIK